jgi:hypothetical protein
MNVISQSLTALIPLDISEAVQIPDHSRMTEGIWRLDGVDEFVVDKVWLNKEPSSPLPVCYGDSGSRRQRMPMATRFLSTSSIIRMFFDSFSMFEANSCVGMASICDQSLSNATFIREVPKSVTRSSARERRQRGGSQCTTVKPSIPSVSTIRSDQALASRTRDLLGQLISVNTHVCHLRSVKWTVR